MRDNNIISEAVFRVVFNNVFEYAEPALLLKIWLFKAISSRYFNFLALRTKSDWQNILFSESFLFGFNASLFYFFNSALFLGLSCCI